MTQCNKNKIDIIIKIWKKCVQLYRNLALKYKRWNRFSYHSGFIKRKTHRFLLLPENMFCSKHWRNINLVICSVLLIGVNETVYKKNTKLQQATLYYFYSNYYWSNISLFYIKIRFYDLFCFISWSLKLLSFNDNHWYQKIIIFVNFAK